MGFSMTVKGFKGLLVWQHAVDLSGSIYSITKNFPKDELFGLTSQMRRCSVSVASNIAEGSKRNTKGEFIQFIGIAKGSLAELQTQAIIANKAGILSHEILVNLEQNIEIISRMLVQLQRSLKAE